MPSSSRADRGHLRSRRTDAFADPEFVERLRGGDAPATEAVVKKYLPEIVRAARGAGLTAAQAEDVAQVTFVAFLEALPRFEARSHVRTFLFGILYRKIADARRHLARGRRVEAIDDLMEDRFAPDGHWLKPPRPIDLRLEHAEVRQGIDECLGEVPVKQKMAFVLREVDGLGTEQICKVLEVSRTNLGVLLYRARNRLRECLEAKGLSN